MQVLDFATFFLFTNFFKCLVIKRRENQTSSSINNSEHKTIMNFLAIDPSKLNLNINENGDNSTNSDTNNESNQVN